MTKICHPQLNLAHVSKLYYCRTIPHHCSHNSDAVHWDPHYLLGSRRGTPAQTWRGLGTLRWHACPAPLAPADLDIDAEAEELQESLKLSMETPAATNVEIHTEDIDEEELQEALTLSMETAAAESGGSVALPATNDAEANIRRRWVTYRMHKRERERETSTGLCSSAVPRRRDREWPSA